MAATDARRNPYRDADLRDADLDAWEAEAVEQVDAPTTQPYLRARARRIAHLVAVVRRQRVLVERAWARQTTLESRVQRLKAVLEGAEDA